MKKTLKKEVMEHCVMLHDFFHMLRSGHSRVTTGMTMGLRLVFLNR